MKRSIVSTLFVVGFAASASALLVAGIEDQGLVPKAPSDLVYARPFEVEKPMEFTIDGKVEKVTKGYVLVLKADLALCEPKNVPDFVLFGGRAQLQRVNSGYRDGHLIVITPDLDLVKTRVWFGSRQVSDRVTSAIAGREEQAAIERGITPFAKEKIEAALRLGGSEVLKAKDMNELWFATKPLILKYAPAERPMAESLEKG